MVHKFQLPGTEPRGVTLSPDGKYIAAGYGLSVFVFDASSGKEIGTLQEGGSTTNAELSIRSICFSPDGVYLVSGGDDKLCWDIKSLSLVMSLPGHTGPIRSVDVSSDGTTAISGSEDSTVCLWNIKTATLMYKLFAARPVKEVAFSPSGSTFIALNWMTKNQDPVHQWGFQRPHAPFRLDAVSQIRGNIWSIAYSADGNSVFTGNMKGQIEKWELARVNGPEGARKKSVFPITQGRVTSIESTADGDWLISCSGKNIIILDPATGAQHVKIQGHDWKIDKIAVGPTSNNGGLFITGSSSDGLVCVWSYTRRLTTHEGLSRHRG
ncbi:Fc.00g102950.m01.CDS01 [Cosmosporella sp. VM-42]